MSEEKKKPAKLTYEQLEAYAAQTTEQAKKIYQENQMLKKALYEQSLREIEIAIKCLDHKDLFSTKFIDATVTRIEELMDPTRGQEDNKPENKEEK